MPRHGRRTLTYIDNTTPPRPSLKLVRAERDAWREAAQLFERLYDLSPGDRAARLAQLHPEPGVQLRIRHLLSAHDCADGVLDRPLWKRRPGRQD